MTPTSPFDHSKTVPHIYNALKRAYAVMNESNADRTIYHLMQLRASQINGCAFCVDMHAREARKDGETGERLDRMVVWRHVDNFSPKERAALAWTEALTVLDPDFDFGSLRAELRRYFSEEEIGVLTVTVAMINLWNRIRVSGYH